MYKNGDRVEVIETDGALKVGEKGTVLVAEGGSVGVVWDNHIGGHSLDERCEYGHGWWIDPIRVKLIGGGEEVKMEGKFKVNDIVVGNEMADDEYGYTTSNAVMKVVAIDSFDDTEIQVEIIHHKNYPHQVGLRYWVSAEHFELKPRQAKKAKKERVVMAKREKVEFIAKGFLNVLGTETDVKSVIYVNEEARLVTVTLIAPKGEVFVGVAKCDKHDGFIADAGIALATSRAMKHMADVAEKQLLEIL